MKHTPGPWEYRNVAGAGLQIYGKPQFAANCVEYTLRANAMQPLFKLLAYETYIQFEPKEWSEMQEANARLIAAAPELLEALRAIADPEHCLTAYTVGELREIAQNAIKNIGGE